jgi:hypothetical protein
MELEVISPMKTWRVPVREGRVPESEYSTFKDMTPGEVQTYCLRRGWLCRWSERRN